MITDLPLTKNRKNKFNNRNLGNTDNTKTGCSKKTVSL